MRMACSVPTAVVMDASKPGQAYHYILDVDQPRPATDFLETGINFRKIGQTVKKNLREVKGMIYEDEFADLAARINMHGPTVIGGRIS